MNKVEANDDYLPQIKQAPTNIATAGKLFDRLELDIQRRAPINGYPRHSQNLLV